MKYFNELTTEQQAIVLDRLQNLPLFINFRNNARDLLMTSKVYLFDEQLNMQVLAEDPKAKQHND